MVYHQLLEDSRYLRWDLEARFGGLTRQDGTFDRKKLGQIVFRDAEALADLTTTSHRYVVAEVKKRLAEGRREGYGAAAIDAIGLFESGLDKICDTTVSVTAPMAVRVARIMEREGISQVYAQARADAQEPESFFICRCDHSLVNEEGDCTAFAVQARTLFASFLKDE